MTIANTTTSASHKKRTALVVCDMQPDLLQSLQQQSSDTTTQTTYHQLLDHTLLCLQAARQAGWPIVFSGLQFHNGYAAVHPQHKLYGALRRLYDIQPNSMKFFLEGHPGAEIEPLLLSDNQNNNNDQEFTVFRQQHRPPRDDIMNILQSHAVTHVVVIGIKAGFAVQAMVQMLCDEGLEEVSVIKECIQDNDEARRHAVVEHLLPCYATVLSLPEMIDTAVGLQVFQYPNNNTNSLAMKTCCFLGRSGHTPLFLYHLQQQQQQQQSTSKIPWCQVPTQTWYTQQSFLQHGKTFRCPLGKRIVDFCDEPQFSKISMFVKGREWLDEKEKLWQLLKDSKDEVRMPETYLIQRDNRESVLFSDDVKSKHKSGPWFVKDVNKNGGRAIQVCHDLEECERYCASSSNNSNSTGTFVVQRHIDHPLLTTDGRKCHIKMYNLLLQTTTTTTTTTTDTPVWQVYTYSEAFLSTSPHVWSPTDLSTETQITIKRHERLCFGQGQTTNITPDYYQSSDCYQNCQANVAKVVETAVAQQKLVSRLPNHKTQFEIFSADFMVDTSGQIYLIECNFTPVLYDPEYVEYQIHQEGKPVEEVLTTKGLRTYHALYKTDPEKLQVNDHVMIRDAMAIVFGDSKANTTKWDLAGTWSTSETN